MSSRLQQFFIFLVLTLAVFGAEAQAYHLNQLTNQRIIVRRLHKLAPHLPKNILTEAVHAYFQAKKEGHVKRPVLTIVDYALPSTKRRLWTFDLSAHGKLMFKLLVAHGKNSGLNYARHFSNKQGSLESSLGVFITRKAYVGHLGYSLRLEGIEPGINDQAATRDIVIHGAHYVNEQFIKHYGRLGRSWGCLAVNKKIVNDFIDTVKEGSVIFDYYPDRNWLHHSHYL